MNAKHKAEECTARKNGRSRFAVAAALLLALVLALSLGASGVFASLKDTTSPVTVNFVPVAVKCAVNDDYSVKNAGDIPALIRVKVVLNWADKDGNVVADAGSLPVPVFSDEWQQLNGFLYYKSAVAAGEVTVPVIKALDKGEVPEGLHLQAVILAEAIQAEPDGQAAQEAWGRTFEGGKWKA